MYAPLRHLTLTLTLALVPAYGVSITNGSFNTPGINDSFSIGVDNTLLGWSTGVTKSSAPNNLDCLIVAGDTTSLCGTPFGGGLTFWINPGPSPDGGNYVSIDGDTNYSTPLTQTISGLTIGKQYVISFYQASGQQSNRDGATTERWRVQLGNQSQLSTLMNTPNHGSVGWMSQSLTFTAAATSDLLSFIAVGTPNGVPPFVFLDGVGIREVANPEPASMFLLGSALIGLAVLRKRRAK